MWSLPRSKYILCQGTTASGETKAASRIRNVDMKKITASSVVAALGTLFIHQAKTEAVHKILADLKITCPCQWK
jgi:hypothetical protein